MALNNDRGEQTQSEWRSRLARERLDLSASVEETLEESASESWREDVQNSDMYTVYHAAHGASLIPPRLSLQSKPMPAVRADSFIETASAEYPAAAAPNPNVLMRLAQRLTSSLAAFGASLRSEGPAASRALLPSEVETSLPLSRSSKGISRIPEGAGLPTSYAEINVSEESRSWLVMPEKPGLTSAWPAAQGGESEFVQNTGVELSAATYEANSASAATPLVQSKQRLAGHTGKIRLQTANSATSARFSSATSSDVPSEVPGTEEQATSMMRKEIEVTSVHLPAVDVWRKKVDMTSARLPAVDVWSEETGGTSIRMPVVSAADGAKVTVPQKLLAGTGMFEYGQMDVIVTSPAITGASVVIVTLTSNPGPVVVQYVSLQPHIGFTVHLTAPATAQTTFNYIILEGGTP